MKPISHVVGFDDAPFSRSHRGDVLIVGAVFCGLRLEGVLSGKVRRDGANATRTLIRVVGGSRFSSHLQTILLQGIAFAGFNVVDLHALYAALEIPVIAVSRHQPDFTAIRRALRRVRGGERKWRLIEQLGPMESAGPIFIQRMGIDYGPAARLVTHLAHHSQLPEPLRTAHLIAGGVTTGESRHQA